MLSNFEFLVHSKVSFDAHMNFPVTFFSPEKLSIIPSHQNLLLQTPHHLLDALSEQPLLKLEAAFQSFLYFFQSYCFFSRPDQGFVPPEVHLLQVHQLVQNMMVSLPTNSQPCTIPATAAQSQLVFTQTLSCSLQLRIPTSDPSSYKFSEQIQLGGFKFQMILHTIY